MKTADRNCRRAAWAVAALALLAWGCHARPSSQPVEKAENALDTFLDAWTREQPASTFAGPERRIQGTDPDWQAGARLLSFLSVESKPVEGDAQRFRCRVALSLQDRQGRKLDREVVYEVQLGDVVVISRAKP